MSNDYKDSDLGRSWSFEEMGSPLNAHADRFLELFRDSPLGELTRKAVEQEDSDDISIDESEDVGQGFKLNPMATMELVFKDAFMLGAYYALLTIREGIEVVSEEDGEETIPSYSIAELMDEAAEHLDLEDIDDDEEDFVDDENDESSKVNVVNLMRDIVSKNLPRKD